MKIRGLLLGTAVAMVAATSAQAADAIIIAEPEPMEYVRICDVYGAGFFYIPGTENCLKIGGYVRYQMDYTHVSITGVGSDYTFTKLARFAPSFDVRSETEWGTLRGFAEVEFDWSPFGTETNLNHAFIELSNATGALLIGKTDNPFARFFYGAPGAYDGDYGGQIYNSGEISYTFNPGNGFSAVLAVVEPGTGLFEPNIEGGVKFEQDWGAVGVVAGFDNVVDEYGVQGVAQVNFAPVSLGVHVFYSSDPANVYGANHPVAAFLGGTATSEWSVLAYGSVDINDSLSANAYVQWFDSISPALDDAWQIKGGLIWEPIADLEILPEVRYTKSSVFGTDVESWDARLRFNRNF